MGISNNRSAGEDRQSMGVCGDLKFCPCLLYKYSCIQLSLSNEGAVHCLLPLSFGDSGCLSGQWV